MVYYLSQYLQIAYYLNISDCVLRESLSANCLLCDVSWLYANGCKILPCFDAPDFQTGRYLINCVVLRQWTAVIRLVTLIRRSSFSPYINISQTPSVQWRENWKTTIKGLMLVSSKNKFPACIVSCSLLLKPEITSKMLVNLLHIISLRGSMLTVSCFSHAAKVLHFSEHTSLFVFLSDQALRIYYYHYHYHHHQSSISFNF